MTVIPFFGVARQYQNLREEILDLTDRVYSAGRVLDGEYTKHFEEKKYPLKCRELTVQITNLFYFLFYFLS